MIIGRKYAGFFYADGVEVPTLGNSQPLKHVQGLRKGISGTAVFSGLAGSVWEFKSTACIDQMIQLNWGKCLDAKMLTGHSKATR